MNDVLTMTHWAAKWRGAKLELGEEEQKQFYDLMSVAIHAEAEAQRLRIRIDQLEEALSAAQAPKG